MQSLPVSPLAQLIEGPCDHSKLGPVYILEYLYFELIIFVLRFKLILKIA